MVLATSFFVSTARAASANFYVGEFALLRGDKEEAVRLFRLATADCPKTFIEHAAAGLELKAMAAKP